VNFPPPIRPRGAQSQFWTDQQFNRRDLRVAREIRWVPGPKTKPLAPMGSFRGTSDACAENALEALAKAFAARYGVGVETVEQNHGGARVVFRAPTWTTEAIGVAVELFWTPFANLSLFLRTF
jgi:hypothetical protein